MAKPALSLMTVALYSTLMTMMSADTAAKSWAVERDGSGDFAVIQEAVDAAASGDTIRIGAGRYDEKRYYTFPGWSDSVRVVVHQHELTLMGMGSETVIGQVQPWDIDQGFHKGIVTGTLVGNSILRVENLRLENAYNGLYTSHTDPCEVIVRACSFNGNRFSTWMSSEGGSVEITGCDFYHLPANGRHVAAWGQTEFALRQCTMSILDDLQMGQSHLNLVGVEAAVVEDCEISEGSTGAVISYGGPTTIRNCLFDGQSIDAIYPSVQSSVSVENCTFRNQNRVVESESSDNQVSMFDCVVVEVADCTFQISHAGSIVAHGCDFATGTRGAVWIEDQPFPCDPVTLDMTDNYWGTDDPDSIQSLIHDRNDSDQACFYIDYDPFRAHSTPVESMSLSELKALMRGGDK